MKKFISILSAITTFGVSLLSAVPVNAASTYTVKGNVYLCSDNPSIFYKSLTVTDSSGDDVNFSVNVTGSGTTYTYNVLVNNAVIKSNQKATCVVRGDVNGDGKVAAADAALAFSAYKNLYRKQSSGLTEKQTFAADVDWGMAASTLGTPKVQAADASYIFSYYKKLYKDKSTAKWPWFK